MENSFKIKVGILGLGLIGSSILKGLENKNYEIYCYSKSSYKKVSKPNVASDDINILKNCDIVFVCSTIEKTLDYLNQLNQILDKNTVVCDVCSIKSNLIDKKFNFNFILTHPMAGSHETGFEAGNKDLFKGAKWLYEIENPILLQIIKDLGAIDVKINMNDHDKLTSQISHLPTILAFLLFENASNDAKQIASSGFRDMTRLAMTSSDISKNMFDLNKENILESFKNLTNKLDDLKKMSDDEKIKLFETISKNRKEMYDSSGKNIFQI